MGLSRKGAVVAALLVVMASSAEAGAQPVAHAARVGPAPASEPLQLALPLRADLAGLRQAALAVSTPGSARYRAYQPLAQLARRYGASAQTRGHVIAYLRAAGATHVRIDPTGLFADATLPAGRAARLFATPLSQFRAVDGSRFIAPSPDIATAASVRLPAGLRGVATGVVGLDTRPLVTAPETAFAARAKRTAHATSQQSSAMHRTGTPGGCAAAQQSGGFTPNQILTAYGYDPLHQAGVNGQGERAALIEIDGFQYADVKAFATCFGLPIPAERTFGVGITKLLKAGGEATLDFEVLDAAAPGLGEVDIFETKPSAADTLEALTAPLGLKHTPQVISASLGLCEPIVKQVVGDAGIFATEGSLEMAAASGITFLASSGDQGSADCTRLDGSPASVLAVNYPASSWWVTGVGGTNLVLNADNTIASQVVWNDTNQQPGSAGGGGESMLFNRPNYQKGSFGPNSRGVPDVSMLSDILPGYAIYCSARPACVNSHNGNPWIAVGGTSAATPLLAGGFTLIDQQLHAGHREALGLVNPLLYTVARGTAGPSVFFDVTSIGNDIGSDIFGRPLGCCSAGPGYDEASGLGSANLAAFSGQALATQPLIVGVSLRVPTRQRPVHDRQLLAAVSCSGPCVMGAYAAVTIGHKKPFEVDSNIAHLSAAGEGALKLRFSSKQVRQLRAGLASRTKISATIHGVLFDSAVYGVLADPGGSIRTRTGGRQLKITG